jgi:hypothetical protein
MAIAEALTGIDVVATAHRGRGLTSPPAETAFLHDSVGPAVLVESPPATAVVRGTVNVRVHAADAGSQMAAITLDAAGLALNPTVQPTLPASVAEATASWHTSAVPDGTHAVAASAVDQAGNATSVSRVVIVDNTPPETAILGEPSERVAQPSASVTFAGSDNLSPVESLRFAWRLDGGPLSPFASDTSATLSALAPGPHAFEVLARDQAGNEDPTPARWLFTVTSPTITPAITAPAAGALVPAGMSIVRGVVESAGAEGVAVSVNGFAALVHGTQWAAQVPITPGANVITAVARTAAGAEGTATVTVSGTAGGQAAVLLRAEPGSGVAPLQVTWRLGNASPRPLVRFELDAHGPRALAPPVAARHGPP